MTRRTLARREGARHHVAVHQFSAVAGSRGDRRASSAMHRWLRLAFPGFASAASGLAASEARAEKAVVAVFEVHDARPKGKLADEELQQLTVYLMAKLAEGRGYRVVPREQMLAAIAGAKKDSFKSCVDERCQIELGKELAAEKSLGTQIIRIGARCVITSTLYDLKTAVSEHAATQRSACDMAALADALDVVVASLGEREPAAAPAAARED